ncbi:MAG: chromosomal replication initiator protein DnaA [Abditibacteriota bacterium]|nr:chromosomal replication initiator protein DnaA [Abditibacteriota bacterium]
MLLDQTKIEKCWIDTLNLLKDLIDEESFKNYIEPIKFEIVGDSIILTTQNDIFKNIINNNYINAIRESLQKKVGFPIDVILKSEKSLTVDEAPKQPAPKPTRINKIDELSMPLNEEFCLDLFVIGPNNRFAAAAAEAVAKSPGKMYNPLFIYGDSGLGKTHLMQSIGNRLLEYRPEAKIFYSTAEYFTSLYVNAITEKKIDSFRKRLKSYDLFLLDDIQFLLGKNQTIQEFFHTFNTLFESKKQIVLTSDRPPKDLSLDERYTSRFEQGMFTEIKKPDYETRLAILQEKVKRENMSFTNDILEYLATIITDNIRKLQGALTNLMGRASLLNENITLEFAKDILSEYYNENQVIIDINRIQEITAQFYNVSIADMIGQSRTKDITLARQVAIYFARELTELSLPAIGKAFGGRDHTTALHSTRKIEEKLQTEPGFREQITKLSGLIVNKEMG